MGIKSILTCISLSINKSSTNTVINNVADVKKSFVGLGLTINQVEKRINSLDKIAKLAATGSAVKDLFSGIKSLKDSVVGSFTRELNFASSFAAIGDKISKTSRLVGFSVKDYQALSSAAQHAGMSAEEMDGALKRFNVNLGKARSGDKSAYKMFDSILGGKKLSGYKDSLSLFTAIADSYKKIGSVEKKAFVSQELFGKSGSKIVELFSEGGAGIKKAVAAFESNGGGFSDKGAENAELFNDELQNVKETINSLKISVAQELFPTFIEIFKTTGKWIKENRNSLIPKIKQLFLFTTDFAKQLLPKIPVVLDKVLSLTNVIGKDVVLAGIALAPIIPSLASVLVSVKIIAAALGGPLLAGIGLCVAAVFYWKKVFMSFYDNWEMFSDFVRNDLKNSFGVLGKYLDWLGDFFADKIFRIYKIVENFNFDDLFGSLKMAVLEMGSMIYDSIFGSIKSAFDAAKSFLKKIPGFGSLFESGSSSVSATASSAMSSSGSGVIPSVSDSAAKMISESSTTVTNRFAVDFKNMPRGVVVTPPENGDFDYSRGYVLGGV